LCSPLHNLNFSNGPHFGRVFGQSGVGNTQDEATTFAMLDDFRFVFFGGLFSWASFSKVWRLNLFSTGILTIIPTPRV